MPSDQTRLDRASFAIALRHGRGKAIMHVLAHGVEGVEDLVLQACLENLAFDAQCEPNRAPWLYEMLKAAHSRDRLFAAIHAALAEPSDEYDLEQVCDLASYMARDGDETAGNLLRSFVLGQKIEHDATWHGTRALLRLDGNSVLHGLARRLGKILRNWPDEYVDSLDYLFDDDDAAGRSALNELERVAKDDPDIALYVEHQHARLAQQIAAQQESEPAKATRKEQYRADALAKFPLDQVLESASQHSTARYPFVRFGKFASAEMLGVVLDRLVAERDPECILRLLWVFQSAEPPALPSRLWELAEDRDPQIRDAANRALSNACHPAVGESGRQFLQRGTFTANDVAVIELFRKNYRAGDEILIMTALEGLQLDDEESHDIGMSLKRLCESNNSPRLAKLLQWGYDNNPCTLCRNDLLSALIETCSLPPSIALEASHDASGETRELVRGYMTASA